MASEPKSLKLLEPYRWGQLTLRNRIVFPPIATSYGTPDGYVTDQEKSYYQAIAKNCGLVIVEAVCVDWEGRILPKQNWICDDRFIPGQKELAEAIHRGGAAAVMQIHHAGIVGYFSGLEKTWGPSRVQYPAWDPVVQDRIQELTVEQIQGIIENFAQGALRAKKAGYDAVEVHGAHGYLLSQFLSPYINRRQDRYGGDLEGRMRIYLETVARIKEVCGSDFPVIVRINGEDKVEDAYHYQWTGPARGVSLEEAKVLACRLEETGADAIHVSAGNYDDIAWEVQPADLPEGCLVPFAEAIKKEVSVPVITVGRINDPFYAEGIINADKADLVAIGRGLIADHDFLEKVQEGRVEEIYRCVGCMNGCMEKAVFNALPMECSINYQVSREGEWKIALASPKKKVLIIGAGLAGLTAARYAAQRGHQVTIWEKKAAAGGQWRLASRIPGKSPFGDFIAKSLIELAKLGVAIAYNREATVEEVLAFQPDAVVIATGARPIPAKVAGEGPEVVGFTEVLEGRAQVGPRVVIRCAEFCCTIRSYAGCQAAAYLAELGKEVSIVSPKAAIIDTMILHNSSRLWQRFGRHGVRVLTNARIRQATPEGVIVELDGEEEIIPADTIVLASGMRSERDLYSSLEGKVPELHLIGDASKVGWMLDATHEGARVGQEI